MGCVYMRRRKRSSVKVYYVIAIICLVILFTGYRYVYNLSEIRKGNKEVETISLVDKSEEIAQKYNKLFAKIMSYFNIFFKETFNEYEENGMFDNNSNINLGSNIQSVESGEGASLDNIEVYKNGEDSNNELYKATILLANNRKNEFFTVSEMFNIASRLSNSIRDLKKYSEEVNKKMNIILFHTHGTEAYKEYAKKNYRSDNVKNNIVGIGSIIAKNLINYGLDITHLKDYNDLPSYNLSYANSKKLVTKHLDSQKKNLIIDIHRDGADAESDYEKILESATRVKINNDYIATFSIVIGGENENIEDLKKIANTVKSVSDSLYPGLCRGVVIRDGAYFNQNISDYALLLEIGSNLNTVEEAKITADFLSEILCNAIVKIDI